MKITLLVHFLLVPLGAHATTSSLRSVDIEEDNREEHRRLSIFAGCRNDDCCDNRANSGCGSGTPHFDDGCVRRIKQRFDYTRCLRGDFKTASPTPAPPPTGGCFSDMALVDIQGTGPTPITNVQIGDRILVENNKYQPVYAFTDNHPSQPTHFLKIHTDHHKNHEDVHAALEVTPKHMMYVHGKTNPVASSAIKVGDSLLASSGEEAKVTKIETVSRVGAFNPVTTGGNIVVNGLQASTYSILRQSDPEYFLGRWVSHQALSHLWMSPFRQYCSARGCEKQGDGKAWWVEFGQSFAKFLSGQYVVVQGLVVVAVVGLFVPVLTVECVVGLGDSSGVLAVAAFLVGTFLLFRPRKNNIGKLKAV